MKTGSYKLALKAAAVKRMQRGENVAELARELNVPRDRLYEWHRRVVAGQPLRPPGRPLKTVPTAASQGEQAGRVQELERVLGQVTAENRFFKGALQRIEELRRPSKGAGAAASTRRSKP